MSRSTKRAYLRPCHEKLRKEVYCLVIFSAFLNTLLCPLSSCFKTILENKIATFLLKVLFIIDNVSIAILQSSSGVCNVDYSLQNLENFQNLFYCLK